MVTRRSRNKKILPLFFFGCLLWGPVVGLAGDAPGSGPPLRRNTDIRVDSQKDLKPFSLNDKSNQKEQRPVFYGDDSAGVGFNDEGDADVRMRW